jgi:hypothetical protein
VQLDADYSLKCSSPPEVILAASSQTTLDLRGRRTGQMASKARANGVPLSTGLQAFGPSQTQTDGIPQHDREIIILCVNRLW